MSSGSPSFRVVNPATDESLESYPSLSADQATRVIDATHQAWLAWRTTPFAERAAHMRQAARLLRSRASDLARLMAVEMGKPVRAGAAEAEKCAWVCDYYADHAEQMLAPQAIETPARKSVVAFRPIGVVLAVMPWNFPLWQVFRFAAPALMAGNAGVLKHAPNVPGCALAIESVLRDAGFPHDLFRSIFVEVEAIDTLIAHRHVAAATLTGSTRAGRAVGANAGQALKKSVLELGGSDPYLVLADADVPLAVAKCAESRLINGGQSCIAAKRFIVVPEVRDAFQAGLVEALARVTPGDPLDPDTELGPLARHDLRDALHRQVEQSIARGARCLLGGRIPPGPGVFYPPTVLTDVGPGMAAYHEETFGPVAAIIPVADEAEAIRVANDSCYGLGAAVFTRDLERGERIARELVEAGCCFVNDYVRSDPRLPFGGIKESGYGRELAEYGIREFTNIKTVYVA